MAQEGASVAVCDINATMLGNTAKELETLGRPCLGLNCLVQFYDLYVIAPIIGESRFRGKWRETRPSLSHFVRNNILAGFVESEDQWSHAGWL
jgi:hypothetical protein